MFYKHFNTEGYHLIFSGFVQVETKASLNPVMLWCLCFQNSELVTFLVRLYNCYNWVKTQCEGSLNMSCKQQNTTTCPLSVCMFFFAFSEWMF